MVLHHREGSITSERCTGLFGDRECAKSSGCKVTHNEAHDCGEAA